MRKLFCGGLVATACLLSAGCTAKAPSQPAATSSMAALDNTAARQLTEVMDAVWERQLDGSLFLRMKLGYPIQRLPRLTLAQARADAEFAAHQLERLAAIDATGLSHDQELSLGLAQWQLRLERDGVSYFQLDNPLTPYNSPLPTIHRAFTSFQFTTSDDLERYEALLADYPRVLQEIQDRLADQLHHQVVLPAAELAVVIPFLQSFHRPALESLFYVESSRLTKIAPPLAESFQARIRQQIDSRVNRRLISLIFFLGNRYEHQAPSEVGLGQYPGGSEYYDYLARAHTTLNLTPKEIHQRGLAEVERLETAMAKLRRSLGHAGRKPEFHHMLAINQRYVAHSAEEIGSRLQSHLTSIEPRLGELFGKLPRTPYAIEPLAEGLAGAMTYGYYQGPSAEEPRGIYFYNGSQPEKRSLLWARSLIYHELIPGHHLQLSLQYENSEAHPLRRYTVTGAFSEGWAEYASGLGEELGLYEGIDLYGRYLAEMLLACRLVVDTGIHHFGWSRQRATEYLREHTMETDEQIASEVLRYATDIPAQALSYKIGAMKIAELRAHAETELGERFDRRRFHDSLLAIGSLPLGLVEDHVEWFIEQERNRPVAAPNHRRRRRHHR